MFKKKKEFKYSFRGINRIVEEKGNQFIRFAQLAWVGDDEEVPVEKIKYDIRKYVNTPDGKEQMLKGFSFLTPEGPDELTYVLLEEGFGKTDKVMKIIKARKDFDESSKEDETPAHSLDDILN